MSEWWLLCWLLSERSPNAALEASIRIGYSVQALQSSRSPSSANHLSCSEIALY